MSSILKKFFVISLFSIYNSFMQIRTLEKKEYIVISKELNVHPLQSYAWGELKQPNWSPIRLGIYEKDEAVAIMTILTKPIPFLGRKFGYIPRGITVKEAKYLGGVLKRLRDYGDELSLSHLMIDPDFDYSSWFKDHEATGKGLRIAFESFGFKVRQRQIQPNRTVVLNLAKSEEALLADMRSKHRQYIRKSERNGVKIRQGSTEDLQAFCRIIEEIVKARGYIMHKSEYYKKVWNLFREGDNVKMFMAQKDGEIIGSYMIIFSSENAYEMYGGCNDKGNELLANYLLKWEAIKYCKQIGKKFYDQWGAEHKYPGLIQFKEGFGGKIIDFLPQYTVVYNEFGFTMYKVFNKVNELRQRISL